MFKLSIWPYKVAIFSNNLHEMADVCSHWIKNLFTENLVLVAKSRCNVVMLRMVQAW